MSRQITLKPTVSSYKIGLPLPGLFMLSVQALIDLPFLLFDVLGIERFSKLVEDLAKYEPRNSVCRGSGHTLSSCAGPDDAIDRANTTHSQHEACDGRNGEASATNIQPRCRDGARGCGGP